MGQPARHGDPFPNPLHDASLVRQARALLGDAKDHRGNPIRLTLAQWAEVLVYGAELEDEGLLDG